MLESVKVLPECIANSPPSLAKRGAWPRPLVLPNVEPPRPACFFDGKTLGCRKRWHSGGVGGVTRLEPTPLVPALENE